MRRTRVHGFAALALTGAALMAMVPSAMAVATWNLSGTCTNCSAATMTGMSAFSTVGNSGTTFLAAGLVSYGGGYGVTALNANSSAAESTATPNHSMDNSGFTDAVLLNFSSSVVLSQLLIGWSAWDSDVTVLRYKGSSAPTLAGNTIIGQTVAGLVAVSNGWEAVGNYQTVASSVQADGGGANSVATNINANGLSSSWWLISAYNSSYGGTNYGTIGSTSDYVKLLSVAGDKFVQQSAPEPGSLALVAAALLAGFATRSRKGRSVESGGALGGLAV